MHVGRMRERRGKVREQEREGEMEAGERREGGRGWRGREMERSGR